MKKKILYICQFIIWSKNCLSDRFLASKMACNCNGNNGCNFLKLKSLEPFSKDILPILQVHKIGVSSNSENNFNRHYWGIFQSINAAENLEIKSFAHKQWPISISYILTLCSKQYSCSELNGAIISSFVHGERKYAISFSGIGTISFFCKKMRRRWSTILKMAIFYAEILGRNNAMPFEQACKTCRMMEADLVNAAQAAASMGNTDLFEVLVEVGS